MIRSMTGFGRAEETSYGTRYSVEVRSVNHRFLDINIRLPREDAALEPKVRRLVAGYLSRGRVDLSLQKDPLEVEAAGISFNRPVVKGLVSLLRGVIEEHNLSKEVGLDHLLMFKELVLTKERGVEEAREWQVVEKVTGDALKALVVSREQEGAGLAGDFVKRISRVERLLNEIAGRAEALREQLKSDIVRRLKLLEPELKLEEARLIQEAAFLSARGDISEELTRATMHLGQFRTTVEGGGAVGRRLGFILQEMVREVNTLGAKVADFPVSSTVVEIKSELEKLKEQGENVE